MCNLNKHALACLGTPCHGRGVNRVKIQEGDTDLSERKTLKVSLPAKLHLQLHTVKILKGKNISDTVEAALDEYFEERVDGGVQANGSGANGSG